MMIRFAYPIMKIFVEENLNMIKTMRFVSERIENILEKGENAGYQHFLLFPKIFSKRTLSQARLKSGFCGNELKQGKLSCRVSD